jgi:hypothetical protein
MVLSVSYVIRFWANKGNHDETDNVTTLSTATPIETPSSGLVRRRGRGVGRRRRSKNPEEAQSVSSTSSRELIELFPTGFPRATA